MSFGNTNSVNLPTERPAMNQVKSSLDGMQKNSFYMSSFNKQSNDSDSNVNEKNQAAKINQPNININPELIANQINFLA